MKYILTSSLALFILVAASCKKEKTAKSNKIGGDYIMYEMEVQSPYQLIPVPTPDGEHGKIIITLTNDSTATLKAQLYDKNDKLEREDTFNAKVGKDQDGDIVLNNGSTLVAYIWEDYDMDFFGYTGLRVGAKKK